MSTSLQALHDKVLALKPADVEHNTVDDPCALCVKAEVLKAAAEGTNQGNPEGGSMSTFTQEQVDALIAEAVAQAVNPLQTKVTELETARAQSEVGQAVAEAVAAKEAELAELQAKADDAEARATAAETAKADLEAWWANAIAQDQEAREVAARRDTRVEELKAAKVFADEYVESNADRFAAMSNEDWTARMDEWKAVAASKVGETIPQYTGFQAARDDAAGTTGSLLGEIGSLRRALVDPRTL